MLRQEVLDRMPILSEAHLRAFSTEFQVHYNAAMSIAQHIPEALP